MITFFFFVMIKVGTQLKRVQRVKFSKRQHIFI